MLDNNSDKSIAKFCIREFGRDINYASELDTKEERELFNKVCFGVIRLDENGQIVASTPNQTARPQEIKGKLRPHSNDASCRDKSLTSGEASDGASKVRSLGYASPIMPSYRGLPAVPPLEARRPEHTKLMVELQIVDLWWLFTHYREVYVALGSGGGTRLPDLLAMLCESDKFDEALARQIAERGVKKAKKYDELGILPSHQFELAQLRSNEVLKRQKSLRANREAIQRHLLGIAARNSKVRGNEADWALAYIAGELSDEMAEACTGSRPEKTSQTDANKIYRKLGGKQIAASSFGTKLKSVREYASKKTSAERRKRIIGASPKQQKSGGGARELRKSA